jgi:hypothetical protein
VYLSAREITSRYRAFDVFLVLAADGTVLFMTLMNVAAFFAVWFGFLHLVSLKSKQLQRRKAVRPVEVAL